MKLREEERDAEEEEDSQVILNKDIAQKEVNTAIDHLKKQQDRTE